MRTSAEIMRDLFTLPLTESMQETPEPCLGSGQCCRKVVCWEGLAAGHSSQGPCPELREHDGRSWCGLVERATGEELTRLRKSLSIGAGCCGTIGNRRRDALVLLGRKAKS